MDSSQGQCRVDTDHREVLSATAGLTGDFVQDLNYLSETMENVPTRRQAGGVWEGMTFQRLGLSL